jgi:hypothetical protein
MQAVFQVGLPYSRPGENRKRVILPPGRRCHNWPRRRKAEADELVRRRVRTAIARQLEYQVLDASKLCLEGLVADLAELGSQVGHV